MHITVNDNFDLEKIISSGQCFRAIQFSGSNQAINQT